MGVTDAVMGDDSNSKITLPHAMKTHCTVKESDSVHYQCKQKAHGLWTKHA